MTYAQIYAHEMRNPSKSSEIVLHLTSCKSATLLDAWNYSKLRFESLPHRRMEKHRSARCGAFLLSLA